MRKLVFKMSGERIDLVNDVGTKLVLCEIQNTNKLNLDSFQNPFTNTNCN